MAKFELKKDTNKKSTEESKDSLKTAEIQTDNIVENKVGRPSQHKEYTSLRIQKKNKFCS